MRIRNRLIGFSIALLLFPTVVIAILMRILYYRIQWDDQLNSGNRLWDLVVANYGVLIAFMLALGVIFLLMAGIVFLRSVLQPLDELQRAAREIEAGNLDVSLSYRGEDEFLPVFEQFDAMRAHVKDLLWKQVEEEQLRVEMIASIAHDFKTPVTAIQGYAQGILEGVANTPEKNERYLRTIITKSDELSRMAQSLYDLSSLEVKTMRFMMQTTPISDMMEEILADAEEQNPNMHIRAALDFPKDALIYVDPMQFQRVISNILQNSFKYRRGDAVQIDVRGEIDGRRVLLHFSDDGVGASAEDCERIFERFYRSDKARSGSVGGSGLGLSIARQIVEEMGGRIWARPNETQGLCMHISFPLLALNESGDQHEMSIGAEGGCGESDFNH